MNLTGDQLHRAIDTGGTFPDDALIAGLEEASQRAPLRVEATTKGSNRTWKNHCVLTASNTSLKCANGG